ncbi:hypothetical protein H0W80_05020 [Candidatus Saccharibacteria bacterium]|nr:hypothetical protein [Candidatus Saccharibacteria bacterium]
MEIRLATKPIAIKDIKELAQKQFGNIIKATVDVEKRILALGGELHADEEQFLLEKNSAQKDLWGINLYPAKFGTPEFIEFDSMINLRPSQNNMSRGVEDVAVKEEIKKVVSELVTE